MIWRVTFYREGHFLCRQVMFGERKVVEQAAAAVAAPGGWTFEVASPLCWT